MTLTASPAGDSPSLPGPPAFLVLVDVTSARITVRGELDRPHAHQLIEAVGMVGRSAAPEWAIDASGITFCDAGGLRALLQANEMAVRTGHTLVIARPSRIVSRLLALVRPEGLPVPEDQQA